jgi:hypothetical protein
LILSSIEEPHANFLGAVFGRHLWTNVSEEDTKIDPIYGPVMGGLSKRALRINDRFILGQSNFGKNPKDIDGKAVKRKAEEALRRCKIYHSYWKEYLVLDSYPSGKNEDDALKYVITRVYNDQKVHTGEVDEVDDDADEEIQDEDAEEDDTNEKVASTSSSSSVSSSTSYSCSTKMDMIPPEKFQPLDFLSFMLMGPWGKDKFNLDICPLLTGDASEYDSVKDGNRKGMRSDADKIHDLTRDAESGRGV